MGHILVNNKKATNGLFESDEHGEFTCTGCSWKFTTQEIFGTRWHVQGHGATGLCNHCQDYSKAGPVCSVRPERGYYIWL